MNLIVDDEYIASAGEYIRNYGEIFDTEYERFVSTMEKLAESGFVEGAYSNSIKSFVTIAEQLKGAISSLTEEIKNSLVYYIDDIDYADEYLY